MDFVPRYSFYCSICEAVIERCSSFKMTAKPLQMLKSCDPPRKTGKKVMTWHVKRDI